MQPTCGFVQLGRTGVQSSAVHIHALYPADGILPGSSSKLRLLVINLASVPGGQLVNSPTAQSRERYMQAMSKHLNITGLLFVTLTFVANICYASDDTNQISKPISRIAKNISKYKTVDGDAVGFAGQMSEQYKRFNSLTKLATDKELILLTDHKNENVRAYAFWALAKRNFAEIKTVLEKHLGDTALIEYYYGCMQTPKRLNSFFLDILTPTHIDAYCFKLTQQEVNSYSKLMIEVSEQKK